MNRLEDTDPNGFDPDNPNDKHWMQNHYYYIKMNLGRKYFLIADEKFIGANFTRGPLDQIMDSKEYRKKYDNGIIVQVTKKPKPI